MQNTNTQISVCTGEASGKLLNALVAMALGHQIFQFDDWTHQVGKDKGRNPDRVDQVIAFSPFRAKWVMIRVNGDRREIVSIPDYEKDANLTIPLLEAARIGVAHDDSDPELGSWRATAEWHIANGSRRWCKCHGSGMLQAGLRCLVTSKLGEQHQVPQALANSMKEPAHV
jgi:hypothetical protein